MPATWPTICCALSFVVASGFGHAGSPRKTGAVLGAAVGLVPVDPGAHSWAQAGRKRAVRMKDSNKSKGRGIKFAL